MKPQPFADAAERLPSSTLQGMGRFGGVPRFATGCWRLVPTRRARATAQKKRPCADRAGMQAGRV
ncbi:MAG: hypothetical protein L5657_05550, partial [Calditerricola sp.]|nr:hypothetical protein [Calditerricola sp.]